MIDTRIDVLIAGAGPVGLAAAIELGLRGIQCRVIERNDRVGYSPRAKTTNVRSREHLRRWGIADSLRKASPMSPEFPCNVVFATRMNGPELARFENAVNGSRARNEMYSEEAQWVPQYVLEEVLRKYAVSLPGVAVTFNAALESFAESAERVVSTIRNIVNGELTQVESAYLIGADGARSLVRELIGATMIGNRALFRNHNTIFRAPELASRQQHGRAIMYWMINDEVPSVLSPLDEKGLWSFIATKLPDNVDPATMDPVDLIRRATGLRDLEVEVVGNYPWVAQQLIADRYATNRVFLAGDACHLHPPFGGFGMNMGIGDAVDLGWKMAASIQGWGGASLLESYELERRRVHDRTIAEAVNNYRLVSNQLVRAGLEDSGPTGEAIRNEVGETIRATKLREFKTLGVVLGYRYESPLIVPDGSPAPPDDAVLYVPSAHPGCLAPHLWLSDGSSIYDHFGPGFTLLITDGDRSQSAGIVSAAAKRALPLTVLSPKEPRLQTRYEARFALIRPDQHVAWRGDALPDDCDALLARVTGTPAELGSMVGEESVSALSHGVARDLVNEITRLEHLRMEALLANDWQTLQSLLTEDLIHIHANGTVESKSAYLQTMATRFEILSIDRPRLDVRTHGETVVVTGPLNQKVRMRQSGDTIDMRAIATQLWIKGPQGWGQCGFQATHVS